MVGIVSYNKSLPCYLNRQIIVLLSALGISDQIFLDMHKKDREEYAKILTNKNAAITKLKSKHISIFEDLNEYPEDLLLEDPFLKNLLFCTYQKRIGELKFRSRVFVEKGNVLIGTCDDELKKLKYGEVFVSVQGEKEQKQKIIEGKVIVTKNPCLHPGDIRILEAKNYPKYSKYYKNCIVFPTQGNLHDIFPIYLNS